MDQKKQEPSAVDMGLTLLCVAFKQHAGDDDKLSKAEFKKLVAEQMPAFSGKGAADDLFKGLDMDSSGSVDFPEFIRLIAEMAYVNFEVIKEIMGSK
ncbi:protein S100-G-like [Centroberyx gerrardi]|uniref:protein S100-G-like n=1 Tax=Centroberyx gerrardi TaxID=166262 RepID=UPI003AAF0508